MAVMNGERPNPIRRQVATGTSLVLLFAAFVGVAFATAPPAAATTPPITSALAPVPSDAVISQFAPPQLYSVSCGAAGSCVAVGSYLDKNSVTQPLIETYFAGSWHASKAPVPTTNPISSPGGVLRKVSCTSGGLCAAWGTFNGGSEYFATVAGGTGGTGGTWHAQGVPTPADAHFADSGGVTSLACEPSGSCYAVGSYFRSYPSLSYSTWAFVDSMTLVAGVPTWSSVRAPTPDFPPIYVENGNGSPGTYSQLSSISCSGSGSCVAVGNFITFQDAVNQSGAWSEQGLIETISNGTVNPGWAAPISGAQNDAWTAQLDQIGCGGGACVASGGYTTNSPTFGTFGVFTDTFSGGGVAPAKAVYPAGAATSQSETGLRASSCGSSGVCVMVGEYNTGAGQAPLLVTGTTPIAAPFVADAPEAFASIGAVSCKSATTCLAAFVTQNGSPTPADTLEIMFGTTWVAARAPAIPNTGAPYASSYQSVACDSEQHCFALAGSGGIVTVGAPPLSTPKVTLTGPSATFTLSKTVTVRWTGSDTGATISHYAVQVRHAGWNGGFGPWSTPSSWSNLSAATVHVAAALSVGYEYCYRVVATDSLGHTATSASRCTELPVDDKSMAASSGWVRATNSAYYLGTYSPTTHLNATLHLTSAQFDRVALVATTCPNCATVQILAGSTIIATVKLAATTTTRKVIFVLPAVSQRTATITVKVVSSGHLAQIDGLGVIRA
jgi:hypothetical protein